MMKLNTYFDGTSTDLLMIHRTILIVYHSTSFVAIGNASGVRKTKLSTERLNLKRGGGAQDRTWPEFYYNLLKTTIVAQLNRTEVKVRCRVKISAEFS